MFPPPQQNVMNARTHTLPPPFPPPNWGRGCGARKFGGGAEALQKSGKSDENIIYGVGGTFRALKKVILSLYEKEEKELISPKSLESLEEELKENSPDTYKKILTINPSRIHTLIPGILIIKVIVSYFNCSGIQVSEFGIREGYLEEKIIGGK